MKHIVRVALAVNRVRSGDPAQSLQELIPLLDQATANEADVILTSLYPLCGAGAHSLFSVPSFRDEVDRLLRGIAVRYADRETPIVIAAADRPILLYQGKLYPSDDAQPLTFGCADAVVAVVCESYRRLPLFAEQMASCGADLFLVPSYHPYRAGDQTAAADTFRLLSRSLGCAFAFCNGGFGDTSSPYLYRGYCGGAEDGVLLDCCSGSPQGGVTFIDYDLDIIRACKAKNGIPSATGDLLFTTPQKSRTPLYRNITVDPYLPTDPTAETAYLEEVFDLQVKSLADRMANTGIRKLVLGVSGGLDSTLAFLVSIAALDRLNLPHDNLIGVTMPGFGTTGRTYRNAVTMIKALGADFREINITESVTRHLAEIGHPIDRTDVTFENAQARERTQILLDLANDNGGFVVGTGDLSEAALGWSTFAGDQMAGYNVNICITKTMIRKIVDLLIRQERFAAANDPLTDIFHSPVSPELLPPDQDGMILQKTEEILGPYELHDFFLYYFVKYGLPPEKIYEYACLAFSDISSEFILEKCRLFFRRLFGGQFKRSCSPDAAAMTEVTLANVDFYLPSDCSPAFFLDSLEHLE